jgi:hypothetical protein
VTAPLLALLLVAGQAPDLSARPGPHGAETNCAACHVAAGWKQVRFDHERTGFPLTGRHQQVTCQACHPGGDFQKPVARACAACHRDVHGGGMGSRCDRCHDTASFHEPGFGPESHRRTAFPLTGRHALLPCEACHGDKRDRTFSRPAVRCEACHQADLARATAAGTDHAAAGFTGDCRTCHGTWRFSPSTFPAHEQCFAIRGGPHAGIACKDCHTTVPPVASATLSCTSGTADCLRCHRSPEIDQRHAGVPGFVASNGRCYECHRFAPGGLGRHAP